MAARISRTVLAFIAPGAPLACKTRRNMFVLCPSYVLMQADAQAGPTLNGAHMQLAFVMAPPLAPHDGVRRERRQQLLVRGREEAYGKRLARAHLRAALGRFL